MSAFRHVRCSQAHTHLQNVKLALFEKLPVFRMKYLHVILVLKSMNVTTQIHAHWQGTVNGLCLKLK